MAAIDAIKRKLHREIVADPVLHGLVLNLYLNGEEYPHLVDDYFPIEVGREWGLDEAMRNHLADEDKHVALYRKAITKLSQPVLALAMPDIFNEVIRSHTPASFAMSPADARDTRRLKLAHFFAHAHFLEKRVARSLEYHIDACAHAASPYPGKAVAAVLQDEGRHVSYTREAVGDLLPRTSANEVLALHARAERRANFDFSARQLTRLLREHSRRFSATGRALFGACTFALRVGLQHG
ncbi:MAG TPA: hypothetical protein VI258_06400 [Rhodanobacteraceae bacterium]